MEERKIRGRSRRRKYKNQMRRPIAVLLALMLSFSSFGTATAYADDAAVVKESVDTAGTQEKVDLDKWMEKENRQRILLGKMQDGSTVADVSGDEGSDGADEGNEAGTVGSVNENGNSQTGEENGQNPSGEQTDNSYDSIERPSQSDTVEIIPGAPSDSKKNESDSNSGTGSAGSVSGTAGDSNSQNGQENVDNSGNQTGGSQETEVKPVLPEEKDYEYIYDKETGKFKVTFNIKEDAKGDQTIELSKVMEEINAAGKKQFDEWFKTEDGAKELDDAQFYGSTIRQSFGGVEYIYNPVNGTASLYEEPGCTTVFDVYLTNGSKHTYVYKNNSFTVSTPDMSNSDHTGVTGFDGQELPEDYTKGFLSPKYDIENASTTGVIEDLVDKALQDTQSQWQYGIDKDGNLTTSHSQKLTKKDIKIGTPVYKIRNKYYLYSEKYDCYYGEFNQAQIEENPKGSGKYVVKLVPSSGKNNYAIKADGSNYYAPYVRGSEINALKPSASRIQMAVKNYLSKNNTTLAQEVLKYYNEKDGTSYATIEELLSKNETAMDELTKSGAADNASLKSMDPMLLHSSSQYDNFYQNIFSFNVGSQEDMKKFLENENLGHGHSHGNWATDGCEMTIGDYMADKLNETDGAWDKANAYFNALLRSGVSSEEATWVAFTMATNIDGPRADNDYQNTAWNWYSSMVLKQQDGTFNLTKVDTDGSQLGDDEGEGQTSFYLWYIDSKTETDEQGNQKTTDVTKYCVYVDPVYETVENEDGTKSQKLVKDGYYGWVEYDPDNKELNYTVSTTNGTLNIDYALLEGVVYYLQEKAAPDGYKVDSNIYVICDEESYQQMTVEKGVSSVINPATGVESAVVYMGAIKGGETLKVNFVNGKTAPKPDPTPDHGGGGSHGGHGGGGSSSDGKKTTSAGPGTVTEEPVLPEQPAEVPIENIPAQGLPKTGEDGVNTSALMLTLGLIASAYVWMSGRREEEENRKN
ncbi:hypothetical protein [Clostridium fessum]|uniref:hypothetical protein n=1 Tax=Clostridium fessum TaxID=2126740 RepID=UPI002942B4AB|nr:hypothetical protein [Clostridium fessum]